MGMRINNNLEAMNATRQLGVNGFNQSKALEKLSSGTRITRAGDDAAGLAISEKMRGQIRGLQQASRNAQDGISMIQTAEGALNETHSILQRMRELAVQGSNDTNVDADRSAIKQELTSLSNEIQRISTSTEFNTQKLLSGSLSGKSFVVGANASVTISLTVSSMSSASLKVQISASTGTAGATEISVSSTTAAQAAMSAINTAITTVSSARSKLGAIQNRLEHTIANLDTAAENLQAKI